MKPCSNKRALITGVARSRKRMKHDIDEAEDRISKLPDAVISHILSFLPTKHAVGTSVLSTSWEKLWTAVCSFHFDEKHLFNPQKYHIVHGLPSSEYMRQCVLTRSNFLDLVNRVFSLTMGSVLLNFSIRIYHPIVKEEFEHLNLWLHEALFRGVRQIDFNVPCCLLDVNIIPTLLLNLVACSNLEVLKLGQTFTLDIPHDVSLPNLKVLHLCRIAISGDVASRLLLSCPRLEDLSIEFVSMTDMSGLNISLPLLRNLVLFIFPPGKNFKIVLDTPCLTFLNFRDEDSIFFHYSDLIYKCPHSLVKAQIWLRHYDRPPEPVSHLLSIVAEKVQFLYLSYVTLKAFSCFYHRWPQFPSLTYLEFFNRIRFDSLTVGCLLNSAEKLQTLVFKKGFFSRSRSNWFTDKRFFETRKKPAYFIHLKLISVGSFTGHESEMEGLDYLLKKAIVLKKLEICCSSKIDQTERLSLTKKLLRLPLPKNCELVVL